MSVVSRVHICLLEYSMVIRMATLRSVVYLNLVGQHACRTIDEVNQQFANGQPVQSCHVMLILPSIQAPIFRMSSDCIRNYFTVVGRNIISFYLFCLTFCGLQKYQHKLWGHKAQMMLVEGKLQSISLRATCWMATYPNECCNLIM